MFRIEDHSCIWVRKNSLCLFKTYFMFSMIFICLIFIPNKRYCFHNVYIIIYALYYKLFFTGRTLPVTYAKSFYKIVKKRKLSETSSLNSMPWLLALGALACYRLILFLFIKFKLTIAGKVLSSTCRTLLNITTNVGIKGLKKRQLFQIRAHPIVIFNQRTQSRTESSSNVCSMRKSC